MFYLLREQASTLRAKTKPSHQNITFLEVHGCFCSQLNSHRKCKSPGTVLFLLVLETVPAETAQAHVSSGQPARVPTARSSQP